MADPAIMEDPALIGLEDIEDKMEQTFTVYAMNKQKGWSESKIKPLANFGTLA